MKVAIVGISHGFTEKEEKDIYLFCAVILHEYNKDDTEIISGGAKGVDQIAIEVAHDLGYNTTVFRPYSMDWPGYKKRNIRIAKVCDRLYCISTPIHNISCYHHMQEEITRPNHEKTAGCWTMNLALKENKPCKLLVTS